MWVRALRWLLFPPGWEKDNLRSAWVAALIRSSRTSYSHCMHIPFARRAVGLWNTNRTISGAQMSEWHQAPGIWPRKVQYKLPLEVPPWIWWPESWNNVRSFFRMLRSSLLFFRDKGSKYYNGSVNHVLLEIRARTLLLFDSRASSSRCLERVFHKLSANFWLLESNPTTLVTHISKVPPNNP